MALLFSTALAAGGAHLVKDINPGKVSSYPGGFTNFGGKTFFSADDGRHGGELWRTDGTKAGTRLFKDIDSGNRNEDRYGPAGFTEAGGMLFFDAGDPDHGFDLFRSDGTVAGTKDIRQTYSNEYPSGLTNLGGTLFFAAGDTDHGDELWRSDGTAAGTTLVRDIDPDSDSSFPRGLTKIGGTLFFTAYDPVHGIGLWRSNGTEAGTELVKDIKPGSGDCPNCIRSGPTDLTNVDGTLFFRADDGAHGYELWRSNGTAAGTEMVKDINPGSDDARAPKDLTNVGGTLFFHVDDGVHGIELWRSNGAAAGTKLVKDINPLGGDAFNYHHENNLANVGGKLLFEADDGVHGYELWRSNGTKAATRMVKDINPGAASSTNHPHALDDFANVGMTLFLGADDGEHGRELWRSDGTKAGTRLVRDIYPGRFGSGISAPANVGGTLYFSARDKHHGLELWKATP